MLVGSLCTGYGGLEMALRLAGVDAQLRFVADPDPGATQLLAHHHPEVPNLGDITTVDWTTVPRVDILTAGYPCQPFSLAGKRKGVTDDRHLWPSVFTAVRVLRPRGGVLLENVPGHLSVGFGRVLGDLAEIGFDARWVCVRASDLGAVHKRERVFIYAWPADTPGHGLETWWQGRAGGGDAADSPGVRHGNARPAGIAGVPATAVTGGASDGRLSLLPTPTATSYGSNQSPSPGAAVRPSLDGLVRLLPTPEAKLASSGPDFARVARDEAGGDDLTTRLFRLLPTPRASDGTHGGPNQRGSRGDLMLSSAAARIGSAVEVQDSHPVGAGGVRDGVGVRGPVAGHELCAEVDQNPADRRREHVGGDAAKVNCGNDCGNACDGGRHTENHLRRPTEAQEPNGAVFDWGIYANTIVRWERITGYRAPAPVEVGPKGGRRLAAVFVEWMMGLPSGHVTGVAGLTRNQQLSLLGNGVVPQQGALAVSLLTASR